MKSSRFLSATAVVCCLYLLVLTPPAYAYVDPNATGLISQILTPLLIAAAAGATFLRKSLGVAVGAMVRRLRRRADA